MTRMLGGAYSNQYKNIERQHVDTIKTILENEKTDSIARAKKLSLETNRRRRALAVKRKSEAEKEEKRRQQILSKRRERLKDATERFQRAHMPPRSNTGSPAGRWSPQRAHTQLEDALRVVRGSPTNLRTSSARTHDRTSPTRSYYRQNSDPLKKQYFNKYAHPSVNQQTGQENKNDLHNKSLRNLNNSRTLFEQQLENHQNSIADQQHKALHDFNQQVMKEIQADYNVVNGHQSNDDNERERSESLSSVDSLEETGSNDTLKLSCDLDSFMDKKNNDNTKNSSKLVAFNDNRSDGKQNNQGNNSRVSSAGSIRSQTGNPYSVQLQERTPEQKQLFYQQRQQEIQQQLQEQQKQKLLLQEKQQMELQQRVLEQQQKQQFLLQQQFQRQQEEQIERQRQEQLEKQKKEILERREEEIKKQKQEQLEREESERQKQQEIEKQKLAQMEKQKQEELAKQEKYEEQRIQQLEKQRLQNYTQQQQDLNQHNTYNAAVANMDNNRPKAQMKAWATPSPHPPDPSLNVTSQNLVTHTSPYTGKSTHTNVTTVSTYAKQGMDSNMTGEPAGHSDVIKPRTGANESGFAENASLSNGVRTDGKSAAGDKSVSFLETVTNGLTQAQQNVNNNCQVKGATSIASQTNKASKTNNSNTSATSSKPSVYSGPYISSYSKAYSASKATQGTTEVRSTSAVTVVDSSRLGGGITVQGGSLSGGTLGLVDGQLVMLQTNGDDGQDTADTDSISTIQEEKEPEPPKEPKGILKRPPCHKRTGILKKSGSTGNVNKTDIRDSLEITRVHLQTTADEKQQRMIRELERSQAPAPVVQKKNVRFADLCYDSEPEPATAEETEERDKLFVKRNTGTSSQKPPRPASAVTSKAGNRTDSKPPRASSATVRTSSIPRAKTQVVRPQAAAHIIAQGSQFSGAVNEDKKVTIINNNFMEKVARANQTSHTATPASVYSVTSTTNSRPGEQKMNYAVSSVVMPKSSSASAPFIYPNYAKQDPVIAQAMQGSRIDEPVYDENGLRIDRTPTDDEINFLWDKVRTCLSRNSQGTPVHTSMSANAPDSQQNLSRQAAPLSHTYIDGNALGQYNNLTTRVAHQTVPNNTSPAVRRQNAMDSAGGSYTKRYGLLQQRKQQPNPNSLKSRQPQQQQQGYTVYHAPVQSNAEPQATAIAQNGQDGMTESMAGFLAAEQLAEQSVSESRIQEVMEQAQLQQQAYNAARPQPKVKSALSVEEQRLLESLDRLNDKLRVNEATIANGAGSGPPTGEQPAPQPQAQKHHLHQHIVHMGGFQGHRPLTAQRRVIETANHKARLRITSAALQRNIHRTQ